MNIVEFTTNKLAEYAPGIPAKGISSDVRKAKDEKWKFGIQRHQANRAGLHYDVRIADPKTGVAHSWALRYLPSPGERRLAVRQPDHTQEYMSFSGKIKEGYGAGIVKKERLEDIDVIESNRNKIIFNAYPGKDIEEYALINTTGNKWLLFNKTPGENYPVPSSKPKYREIKPDDVTFNDDQIMQGKLDGAHNTYLLKGLQPVRAFSYRPSERKTGPIQHTDRIEGMRQTKAPRSLDNTVLRGDIVAINNKGKALPSRELGGFLNGNVWKTRSKLDNRNAKLLNYIFDVVRFRGKDYENKPYKDKKKVLELVAKAMPHLFRLPPEARTPKAKKELYKRILKGQEPLTREGVILWDPDKSKPATKIKFKPDFDVIIKDIFKSSKRGEAGGFVYDRVDGKKISKNSRVGTGFSRRLKIDMLSRPYVYKGLVAKIKAMEQLPSGALRAPSFSSFHESKNPTDRLPSIQK